MVAVGLINKQKLVHLFAHIWVTQDGRARALSLSESLAVTCSWHNAAWNKMEVLPEEGRGGREVGD